MHGALWNGAHTTEEDAERDQYEVVELDGKPILELLPVRFERIKEGVTFKIKAVQDYRMPKGGQYAEAGVVRG